MKTLNELFVEWCKETGRGGSVLVGKSIKEFFNWLSEKGYKIIKDEDNKQ